MVEYKVQFTVFEGPLDLLLYLVKKEEVDIYQVNLTRLATQFIEYVELMKELDLDLAGEFLVMAATLMLIKSRELLPRDQQAVGGPDDEDLEDPRWELIRKLVEYKKYKDAAAELQKLERLRELTFARQVPPPEALAPAAPSRPDVTLFDLVGALNAVLKRFQERARPGEILDDRWTVSEKLELLRARLAAGQPLRFTELFDHASHRAEIVVTFLALLELIRLRVAVARQDAPFGEIYIEAAPPGTPEPPPPPAAPAPGPADPASVAPLAS
jgi:segregation and condensation protein A